MRRGRAGEPHTAAVFPAQSSRSSLAPSGGGLGGHRRGGECRQGCLNPFLDQALDVLAGSVGDGSGQQSFEGVAEEAEPAGIVAGQLALLDFEQLIGEPGRVGAGSGPGHGVEGFEGGPGQDVSRDHGDCRATVLFLNQPAASQLDLLGGGKETVPGAVVRLALGEGAAAVLAEVGNHQEAFVSSDALEHDTAGWSLGIDQCGVGGIGHRWVLKR